MTSSPESWRYLVLGCVVASTLWPHPAQPETSIFDYIRRSWHTLTRSHAGLATAAADPKSKPRADGKWPVYIAASEDYGRIARELRSQMAPRDFDSVDLLPLPKDLHEPVIPGLLYLPRPYVVPGGRFNEMYGWDSYFIQMGLLRDNELGLAKDMADNALYEIRAYGKILNANRSYYLTRSQPPFLTGMLLAMYERTHDRQWLADSIPAVEEYYRYWTTEPHLTPATGLSRYFDSGHGPAPEVLSSELDKRGRTDYDLVKAFFRTHHVADYDASRFYDAHRDKLTQAFYEGDRSMRESGFDPSNRFGPFSADIVHYNPVCLNSLLYLMEVQAAEMLQQLGREKESEAWMKRAGIRAGTVNRLMWDQSRGLYFDYDFTRHQVREYPFLTTFYPLWVGIASREQAARVMQNLPLFEKPGGLETSTYHSGDQWDAPYGWAPLEWIAVEGMRRYGYRDEAERVSLRFLAMVWNQYRKHGVIVEKYDVTTMGDDVGEKLRFGYHSNEVGFGWTNAVFTSLYDGLSAAGRARLREQLKR